MPPPLTRSSLGAAPRSFLTRAGSRYVVSLVPDITVTSPRSASRTYAITGSRGVVEAGSLTTAGLSSAVTAAGTAIAAAPAAAPAEALRNDRRVTPSPSVLSVLINAPLRWTSAPKNEPLERIRTAHDHGSLP